MALEDVCNFQIEPTVSEIFERGSETTFQGPSDFPLKFYVPFSCKRSPTSLPKHSTVEVRRPFPLTHGTTTLGFIFQGGVIAAADTRASAGGLVACASAQKITPLHSHLVATSSGSSSDCTLWKRILIREIRLYQLRHKRRLSIRGAAKLLSSMLHPFKGTDVCVALTLCGWDKEDTPQNSEILENIPSVADDCSSAVAPKSNLQLCSGPALIYVCSDGARLQGDLFSVGSGSPYAYGVLDESVKWGMSTEEGISLAREAVYRATHRDAYSGNNVDLFHVTAEGWSRRKRENLKEEYYRDEERRLKKITDTSQS